MRNPSPCTQDCERRGAGCAVTCPEWAKYVAKRDADYAKRAEKCVNGLFTPGGVSTTKRHTKDKTRGRVHWK